MSHFFSKYREIVEKILKKREREKVKGITRLQSKRHITMDPNKRGAGPEAPQCSKAENISETEKQ